MLSNAAATNEMNATSAAMGLSMNEINAKVAAMLAATNERNAKVAARNAAIDAGVKARNAAIDAGVKARLAREAASMARTMMDVSNDSAECPMCERKFRGGWYHPADQKLYDHMRHGKAHRSYSNNMPWDTRKWCHTR
jgi:hypothetical protein